MRWADLPVDMCMQCGEGSVVAKGFMLVLGMFLFVRVFFCTMPPCTFSVLILFSSLLLRLIA